MPRTTSPRRGRPAVSSRADLEDAAAELFLERTYAATSIADITQRAGVSRTTFFNYFAAKSDVLWSTVDTHVGGVASRLAEAPARTPPMAAVREAFLRVVAGIGPESVPWALTQRELMGTREILESSGLARFMEQAAVLSAFLSRRTRIPASDVRVQSAAFAVLGAVAAAAGAWAGDGVGRRPLREYVDDALTPVCAGLEPALAAPASALSTSTGPSSTGPALSTSTGPSSTGPGPSTTESRRNRQGDVHRGSGSTTAPSPGMP